MSYFVVRDTEHPEEDLKRNWSSVLGGWDNGDFVGMTFNSEEEARAAWEQYHDGAEFAPKRTFRYHPAYQSFVPVHYEGLGAWSLEAESLEEAIEEAESIADDLAVTAEAGDGHFFAPNVVSFHFVREGRYVFEIKI